MTAHRRDDATAENRAAPRSGSASALPSRPASAAAPVPAGADAAAGSGTDAAAGSGAGSGTDAGAGSGTDAGTDAGSGLRLSDEAYLRNPYPFYARLRRELPVHRVAVPGRFDMWLVTRREDVRTVLTAPQVSKDAGRLAEVAHRLDPEKAPIVAHALATHMLNSDPPRHTRLRRLVAKAFTSSRVEQLRPRIEEITQELLDSLAAHETADLMEAFASPLPITVICELLGVPPADQADFRRWSASQLSNDCSPETIASDSRSLADYLAALIGEKRKKPTGDLLTDLVQASDDGDRLSDGELLSMAFVLLLGGHETTANLVGNGVRALLTHPGQWAALRADPARVAGAVEELLRYDPPLITGTDRMTTAPLQLGEVTVPAGELLLVSLGSANHDASAFDNAEDLDLSRTARGHLAFGHGVHYCVGAPLARLEAVTALNGLLRRFPDLALAVEPDDLRYRNSVLLRALRSLPVHPHGARGTARR